MWTFERSIVCDLAIYDHIIEGIDILHISKYS